MADTEGRDRDAAKEMLDRAEREIRHLTEVGVDVGALGDRFETAKSQFNEQNWTGVQRACGEVLVLAKSMQAITAASLKAGTRGKAGEKLSESMRLELSRLVAAEVSNRVETVARTLPTSSSIEELVQTKIQEALVTGGLISRLEAVATDKAQAAMASVPRFTAKDAQAAANLVVQRALTQFLSSKELGTRIAAAVESALAKALSEAEDRINKSVEAQINTRVASGLSQLPTNESVAGGIQQALGRFLKEAPLEERILTLAAERAKAEVSRAPDLMAEAASRIAREEANALLKTHTRSQEFVDHVKQMVRESAGEIAAGIPRMGQEDVEIIARGVADESLASLAESDVMRERIGAQAKGVVDAALSAAGFDDKARAIAQQVVDAGPRVSPDDLARAVDKGLAAVDGKIAGAVAQARTDLMTNEDFASWIRDGALEAIKEAGLAGSTEELEKKILTKDKVERIARHEALAVAIDLLEKKEFTRRIVEIMDDKAVRAKLEDVAGGASPEKMEEVAELRAKNVFMELLDGTEFAGKVKELAGGAEEVKAVSERLAERIGKIEKEALPALVDRMLKEKLGGSSAEAAAGKVEEAVQKALAASLDPKAIEQQIGRIAEASIKDIANSPVFKAMLDDKFKAIMAYLTGEVIPKQIRRLMGGG